MRGRDVKPSYDVKRISVHQACTRDVVTRRKDVEARTDVARVMPGDARRVV